MSDQNTPDYGTPPEPKYGRRITPVNVPERADYPPQTLSDFRASLREPRIPDGRGPRRDTFGIVLALILLTIAGLAAWGALNGGWWSLLWIVVAPFGLFGLVGLNIDGRKRVRDSNGRPVR